MSDSKGEHIARSQIAKLVLFVCAVLQADTAKSEPAEAQRVVINLPPFWSEMPNVWFKHIEAQFENAEVTDDSTKYNYIVGNLDLQFLKEVEDVVLSPPPPPPLTGTRH